MTFFFIALAVSMSLILFEVVIKIWNGAASNLLYPTEFMDSYSSIIPCEIFSLRGLVDKNLSSSIPLMYSRTI